MKTRTSLLLFCLSLGLAPGAWAGDHWVGPPGSGYPFQEIQAAVEAALPGDRVFVVAGDYGPVTLTKSIQLSGEGSGNTRILGIQDASGAGRPALSIVGLPSSQRVLFHGFELLFDDAATTKTTRLIELSDCAGGIELFDLKMVRDQLDATLPGEEAAYLWIENCPRVAASDVRFITAPVSAATLGPVEPYSALRAIHSNVTFSDSRFDAAYTPFAAAGLELSGADAIELVNSDLWLGFSTVRGGARGDQGSDPAVLAGDGIDALNSSVVIHGGRNNQVLGGPSEHAGGPGAAAAGAAVRLDSTSRLEYAVDANLVGGKGLVGTSASAIAQASGSTVVAHPDRLPTMWVLNPIGALNTKQPLTLEGDPGATHLWWFGLQTTAPLPVPGVSGSWWMLNAASILNLPVVIEPNGFSTVELAIPNLPQLNGLMLCYQNLELDGTNLQLAPPWFAVVAIL